MTLAYSNTKNISSFSEALLKLQGMIGYLESKQAQELEHGAIESYIHDEGHEVLRKLLQGFLDEKATNEERKTVYSADKVQLTHLKTAQSRNLESVFGQVTVKRNSYSQRHQPSQFPMDAELNLPNDKYSDGLRARAVAEAIRGSYDDAVTSIDSTTGGHIPKRQTMQVIQDVAQDFDDYYFQKRYIHPEDTRDLLVITTDAKGIVMQPNSLRECTKKAAKKQKLKGRLSAGEKKDRKRMAQVASVYTTKACPRTAESIMQRSEESNVHGFRVPPRNKRVWASLKKGSESVIEDAFLEALQRDPEQKRQWIVLVDGHPHQMKQVNRVAKKHNVTVTIILDFIHVLEYLWKAAWCLFDKGDELVEGWVEYKALEILRGKASQVAKGLGICATKRRLVNRENIDKCRRYLLKNKKQLEYGIALECGYPIASGVIEGACRHLINDRLDITGARWSLDGAEAILRLRSVKSSGDLQDYWNFHKQQAKQRLYG